MNKKKIFSIEEYEQKVQYAQEETAERICNLIDYELAELNVGIVLGSREGSRELAMIRKKIQKKFMEEPQIKRLSKS